LAVVLELAELLFTDVDKLGVEARLQLGKVGCVWQRMQIGHYPELPHECLVTSRRLRIVIMRTDSENKSGRKET
jgi:hypothetical protein